jgi:hypothetical protein
VDRAAWRDVRRRGQALVQALRIPDPFDLAAFCETVAARRGRQLVLKPVRGIGHRITGLWLATAVPPLDVIVYEQQTTTLHQEHIIVHELAHMLCGHAPLSLGAETARQLFPDLRPDAVRRVLARQSYSSVEEQEAELLASFILLLAKRPVDAPRAPGEPGRSPVERLEAFQRG